MLKYTNYDIVFQEVPGEVTLAINISGCPNRCVGCHTPLLREDVGENLTQAVVAELMQRYISAITCVCFMGGDNCTDEVCSLAAFVKQQSEGRIKSAWYSGRQSFPPTCFIEAFDFIKLGPYIEELGGLKSVDTNQRFYRIKSGQMVDMTTSFQRG